MVLQSDVSLSSRLDCVGGPDGRRTLCGVRCYVEPSPAGGYFVRLRGEAAPLSRHDTEEEAEAAAAAYDRGLARQDTGEYVAARATARRCSSAPSAPRTSRCSSPAGRTSPTSRSTGASWQLARRALGRRAGVLHRDRPRRPRGDRRARPGRRRGRRRRALRARARAPARGRGRRDRRRRLAAPRARRQAAAPAVRARHREPHPGLHRVAAGHQRGDADALRPARRGRRSRRRDGPTLEIDVELPVELPTLEHTLREAAAGHVRGRRA